VGAPAPDVTGRRKKAIAGAKREWQIPCGEIAEALFSARDRLPHLPQKPHIFGKLLRLASLVCGMK
jgi:hypothetical protein